MILVDANILLYAEDALSPRHRKAREWWDAQLSGAAPVCLCWTVLTAFIRISTNPRVFARPLSVDAAMDRVQSWLDQPCVRVIQPTERHWALFQRMLREGQASANLVTDAHLAAFGALRFPALRQIYLPHAAQVTDAGVACLSNFPALEGLQLIGTGITDKSLEAFATSFPALVGINVEECDRLTVAGFLALAQSPTIANVSLSLDPLTPADVERIIQAATNVTWWFIRDRQGQLELGALARLADERQIRISVVDANNHSRSVKNTQPNAAQ